jgi:hypothetical protein
MIFQGHPPAGTEVLSRRASFGDRGICMHGDGVSAFSGDGGPIVLEFSGDGGPIVLVFP